MDAQLLKPEVRKAVTSVPRLPFGVPGLHWLARLVYNLAAGSQLDDRVTVENRTVHGRKHRIIRPASGVTSRAVALWFYGGGHLAGKPEHLDALGSLIALRYGMTFIAPEYRLAPEHPYPADLDDATQSWHWLLDQSDSLDIDRDRIAIGGNSAGGGIAAALAHWLHDSGGTQPRAQVLFYPMLDDRTAANDTLDVANHFIWNNTQNRRAWRAYLGPAQLGADRLPPYAAPARRDNLSGLPPTWIGQCGLDLFFDEYQDYGMRLTDAGVECETMTVDGVPHAFEALCPDEAVSVSFNEAALDFLARQLDLQR